MSQTILISGASGFIASHVIRLFLESGFKVRGTVRSEVSAKIVRETHAEYADALSFAFVKDISAPGAFDEAVKGVDGVIHTASPFILDAEDYDKELFNPAVNGTVSILKAVKEHNPSVKRIVVTSSFGAILDYTAGHQPGYIYTEADWNPMTANEAHGADPVAAYLVSKTLAEKAAFEFVETQKPSFSIVTVAPPLVYGPLLHGYESMSKLNTSSADIYRLFNGSSKEVPDTVFWACVDVRDVAKAHLLAYQTPTAANQRYIISAGSFSYQIFCNIIRARFPELVATTPEDKSSLPFPDVYKLDTTKAKNELGIAFRPIKETLMDTVTSLKELEKITA
ncbi:Uncharacterized protein BP5553_06374 [Venustampulla echinocandica]|uniref:NAD-dependent epimerase/dehydratase domain-containing protein n=1 Tax=Venustampulla echinocandica TaxID=2656787 RepID=A0A370TJR1_9HELO|nr:Uncharacterized protein BP5553_06374 [Venustampulla echinocandica]RDL35762.1 Uncharacterized protein BP5553_06374 [Venustampulla echinocandica]